MLYDLYDDYLDVFGDDIKYFDDLEKLYPSFDIVDRDELSLSMRFGDIFILAELHNCTSKYSLKCYINKNQTSYRFNDIKKLKDKTVKMNRFIIKHSCCITVI
jgi:hypothetical protein